MKIGIPRALIYYKYKYLWEKYFEKLNIELVYSDTTTKKTLKDGIKYSIDESCLASKIYMGHVYSLIGKCDYILIPRVCSYGKKEETCVRFNGLYDNVASTFNANVLTYDIDVENKKYERNGLVEIGLQLNKSKKDCIKAYNCAKEYELEMKEKNLKNQINKLNKSTKKNVLIVSHPYNAYDELIGKSIKNIIKKNDLEYIDSSVIDEKVAVKLSKKISKDLYWTDSKIIIGSILYYKNKIDGIIFLSSFPCGLDSISYELASRKIKGVPRINIIYDEQSGLAGFETRLESFADMIKGDNYG